MDDYVLKGKYLIIFFLVFLFSNNSYAQIDTLDSTIIRGGRVTSNKKNKTLIPIGLDELGGSFIVLIEQVQVGFKQTPFLVHFDSGMNKMNSVALPLSFQSALFLKNELYIISSIFSEITHTETVYVQKFNKITLLPDENAKMLCSMNYLNFDSSCIPIDEPEGIFTHCMVKASRDQTKVMITTNSNCQLNETRSVWVFDDIFNLLWSKEIPLKATKNQVAQTDIDNNGNVFFAIRSKDSKHKLEYEVPDNYYAFYVLGFFTNGNVVKEFPVVLKDKVIIDLAISVDNNNVMCAGFYMKINPYRVAGTFFLKIDQSLEVMTKITYDDFDVHILLTKCSEEALQKVKEDVNSKRSFPHLGNFTTGLYCSQKGSVFLTGEINYRGENTAYFRQLFAFKYSNEGELIWSHKISKYQQTNGWGQYSSCFAACVGEDLYIVYNDNTSNFNRKSCEVPDIFTLRSEFMLVSVKIDEKGAATKKFILPNLKQDVWMRPMMTNIFNNDQLILIGESYVDHSYKIFKATLRY
jgi:hypothetical protein